MLGATLLRCFVVLAATLLWLAAAQDQARAQASVALYCWNPTGSSATNNQYLPCSASNPLEVAATITPPGTQNVNLTQILGSAVSASNPLPVTPGISPSSAVGLPPIVSSATEASHIMCSATCNLYGFQVNTTSALVWIMAFDATSLPANGAVTPKKWWQVAANATLGASWAGGPPLNLATGLVLGCSTTGPFTLTATATCDFSAEVKQ